jgi:hypothetical protein
LGKLPEVPKLLKIAEIQTRQGGQHESSLKISNWQLATGNWPERDGAGI